MKRKFIALIAVVAFGATFAGCAADSKGTNLGRAIDGNGYNGYYYGGTTGTTDPTNGTDYYGVTDGYYDYGNGRYNYNSYGTGYNGGLTGTLYGDDSGYSTYMNNSYRQGTIQNNLGTTDGRMYSTLYGN